MHLAQAMSLVHPTSPYAGFDPGGYPLDLQGWASESPVFAEAIAKIRPQQIIEVGTWKGASAVNMAKLCQAQGLQPTVVCVDTWLGAVEHLERPDWRQDLRLSHGYPQLYYQFLANVMHSGLTEAILPFAQTSVNAARFFRKQGVQADLVYLDGSHEEGDVYADILHYWALVRPGGLLIGDDFILNFPGVIADVKRFAREFKQPVRTFREKWYAQKPEAATA